MAEYKRIRVTASGSYDVIIAPNGLSEIGNYCKKEVGSHKFVMLTDSNVDHLYSDIVIKSFEANNLSITKYVIEAGEQSKDINHLMDFIDFMVDSHITRNDIVLALGGGVVGDMAGFAAAIYQRGINFIQIPTTLLACVDSSVGGKTAVDTRSAKNMIGAFHQPIMVFSDTTILNTLPKNILRDGFAEVIKYGVILDKELFDAVQDPDDLDINHIISRCVEIKRDVVANDEFDHGMRTLLNFGHTIGHAIEKLSNFTISHGEAVAKGMVRAALMGKESGLGDYSKPIIDVLKRFGFDINCEYDAQQLYEAALSDKKCNDDGIILILPQKIGECGMYSVNKKNLLSLLKITK